MNKEIIQLVCLATLITTICPMPVALGQTSMTSTTSGKNSPIVNVLPGGSSVVNYVIKKAPETNKNIKAAENFLNEGNAKKALPYAKKAYDENRLYPNAIYTYCIVLQALGKNELLQKVLIENLDILGNKERAILAVNEYNAKHFYKSFAIAEKLDLLDIPSIIESAVLTAYARSAFASLPYENALFHVQKAVVLLNRKKSLYGADQTIVTLTKTRQQKDLSLDVNLLARLIGAEFAIASTLLEEVAKNKDSSNIAPALELANYALANCANGIKVVLRNRAGTPIDELTISLGKPLSSLTNNSLMNDKSLLAYLTWFNWIISSVHPALDANKEAILDTVRNSVKILSASTANGSDVQRLGLLFNFLADYYGIDERIDLNIKERFTVIAKLAVEHPVGIHSIDLYRSVPAELVEHITLADNTKSFFKESYVVWEPGTYGKSSKYRIWAESLSLGGNKGSHPIIPLVFN